MNKRPPSLNDVATLAGVSTGTVSRAISKPHLLTEKTRKRVFEAINQLRYVPNGAARALAMKRTLTVGAVVPRFGSSGFSTLLQALENELTDAGYTLLLSAPDHKRAQDINPIATLLERGVDALAILGYEDRPDIFTSLNDQGVPFIRLWAPQNSPWPSIGFDEHQAAELMVDYLYGLGHRKIAFIGGKIAHNERARERQEGIMLALSSRNMSLPSDARIESDYGFQEGFDAMQQLISRSCDFTAVICGNDYLAAGAISALHVNDISVPGKISVAGFNDNDFSAFLNPALTTIRLPIEEMGRNAAHYLLTHLDKAIIPLPMELPVSLVKRASTGPATIQNSQAC